MLKDAIHDSETVSKLQMHRTKWTIIIKNVLSPHFQDDLLHGIGKGNYSLLLDESNDIAVHKRLGIAIIYFSQYQKRASSTYLNVVELEPCNAMQSSML